MTESEFDVLDELYFVLSFKELLQNVSIAEPELKDVLHSLLQKKWIKCLLSPDYELAGNELDFDNRYNTYYYLATKAGLLAHNTR